MKIKNLLFNAVLGLSCLFAAQASAQMIIQPTNNESVAGLNSCMSSNVEWIENAIMNYGTGSTDNLLAITWFARSNGCSGITFSEDDGTTWASQTFNPLSTYNLHSYQCSNVLIGGPYGSGNEYIMAVVYRANDPGGLVQVYMDLYTITDPGIIGSTGFVPSCTIRLSDPMVSNQGIEDVRADVITKDVSSTLQADKFVVAWKDHAVVTLGGGVGISTFYGSLSGIESGCTLGTFNRYSTSSLSSNRPVDNFDIAGYEGVNTDTAIITFLMGKNILWGKWEVNTAALSGPMTTMHAGTASSMPGLPRVDAMDPYTINSIYRTTFFTSTYNVLVGGTSNYVNYYNILAGNNVATSTLSSLGYDGGITPVVACGPNSPDQYSIAYTSAMTGGGSLNALLQPIDASTGTLYSTDYYKVDQNGKQPMGLALSNDWIGSSGGPVASSDFLAWMSNDTIKYKITSTATTPSFKPTVVGTVQRSGGISIAPNPAKDVINVKGLKNNEGANYSITDITGRIIQSGRVKVSSNHIDISGLSAGLYILDIGDSEKLKFVKQ